MGIAIISDQRYLEKPYDEESIMAEETDVRRKELYTQYENDCADTAQSYPDDHIVFMQTVLEAMKLYRKGHFDELQLADRMYNIVSDAITETVEHYL